MANTTDLTHGRARPAPLEQNLVRMGFSEPEARAYAALITVQPATAYEVAKTSGLPRANAYNAVTNLVAKGAVQPVTSQPVKYAITSPEHFFAQIAEDTRTAAETIRDQVAALAVPAGSDFVEVSDGRLALVDKVASLIASATTTLQAKANAGLLAPFRDALSQAIDRGVRITVVGSGDGWDELAALGVEIVPHEGTGSAPSVANEVVLTVVADAAQGFVGTFGHIHRGYSAENPSIVYTMQTMILHEIYLAKIISALGHDHLKANGLDIEALRKLYRPPTHGMRMAQEP
ncbi:TrmB family transcriptional regulator [Rhodobacteraceae bacterium CCMM004]|nr:TrmB family transcriptional regulator [Rhodobacteraceae bacterium CCMM004]